MSKTVKINAAGGTGAYQYSIDGSTYQSSNTFMEVEEGDYYGYVKDENNCEASGSFNVASSITPWDGNTYDIAAEGTVFKISATGTNPSPIAGFGDPHGGQVVGEGAFVDSWEDIGSHVLIVKSDDVAHSPGQSTTSEPEAGYYYPYIGNYDKSTDTFTLSSIVTSANGDAASNRGSSSPQAGARSFMFASMGGRAVSLTTDTSDANGNFNGSSRTTAAFSGFTGPGTVSIGSSQWFFLGYMGRNMQRTVNYVWWWTEGAIASQPKFPSGATTYKGRVAYRHATTMAEAGIASMAIYNSSSYPNGHPYTQLEVTTERVKDGTYPTILGTTTSWPAIST